ncbi:rhodanese-like domain-containing protein [Cryptosporangium aurantiacum]|uniref:Rhodanese-related sulfurtransferase n=1 Tax=Cryptosporangium aurantiacum TaxID=134849 RepID=A0A1M7Q4V6_9ACTN|nr:rhodanese-like domain-containing protein [Cryptosporangium aurantiacum]SHN25302.1 Rhodanese-related sulfurtransferase [Cryptosporangium aurantiacum]
MTAPRVLRGLVTRVPAADPTEAVARLAERFRFETDCADVASDLAHGVEGFVIVDARSPEKFAAGHLPGAVNLPTRTISEATTAGLDRSLVYVTYCDGPHCNGSTRSALRLAELGFRVKEMIGGFHFWTIDGHPVE